MKMHRYFVFSGCTEDIEGTSFVVEASSESKAKELVAQNHECCIVGPAYTREQLERLIPLLVEGFQGIGGVDFKEAVAGTGGAA